MLGGNLSNNLVELRIQMTRVSVCKSDCLNSPCKCYRPREAVILQRAVPPVVPSQVTRPFAFFPKSLRALPVPYRIILHIHVTYRVSLLHTDLAGNVAHQQERQHQGGSKGEEVLPSSTLLELLLLLR